MIKTDAPGNVSYFYQNGGVKEPDAVGWQDITPLISPAGNLSGFDPTLKLIGLNSCGASGGGLILDYGGLFSTDGGDMEPLPDLDDVWVDFSWGGLEVGTQPEQFDTIGEGISAVIPTRTIFIKPGESPETPRITKPMRLVAVGGNARIGVTGAGQPQNEPTILFQWTAPPDWTHYR